MPTKDGKLTTAEQAELSALLYNINNSGKKGRKALKAAIEAAADENTAFAPHLKPYLDHFKDVTDDVQALDAKPMTRAEIDALFEEREGKRRADEEKTLRASERQKLLDDGRFTAETIKGLDEFVTKNGYDNLSIDDAATLYAHNSPPSTRPVIGQTDKMWELPKDKTLLSNPRRAGLQKAYAVVDEMRRRA
jgi:hypothetical protein